MSDGDEEPEETTEDASGETEAPVPDVDAETLRERLDDAAATLEDTETEAGLDDVEATLTDVEADLEAAELPEPDGEDEQAPAEAIESRLSDLREDLEAERGPYAADVASAIEDAQSTLESTEWTDQGLGELQAAVTTFLDETGEVLEETLAGGETPAVEAMVAELDEVTAAVEDARLDPDEDADSIEALVAATDDLSADVDDAQKYDDLSVRQKLRTEGYYEVMGQKHKDFPPEWTALKGWEQRENVDMILLCLEHMGDSDFMERHCLEALRRIGSEESLEEIGQRAARRDTIAIETVGKIGSEDGLEHVLDYVDSDSNPALQKKAIKAVGEIGSEDATQDVADQLEADNDSVRSGAARSLGLIGDTRAIEPLADVLAEDEADSVRASAAWALVQIGTERALETAAEYTDDRAYIVETEAEEAAEALDGDAAEAAA